MLSLIVSVSIAAGVGAPAAPWDRAPFEATPAELLRAAAGLKPTDDAAVDTYLLEDFLSLDDQGRLSSSRRVVYRPLNADAVRATGLISVVWQPRYQERPVIKARVVSAKGEERRLDPSTLSEASAESEEDLLTDRRILRGPLPGVESGAVVEVVVERRDREPYHAAGSSWVFELGGVAPRRIHMRLEVAKSLPFRHVVRGMPDAVKEARADGRRILDWEWSGLPVEPDPEPLEPAVLSGERHLAFSTGASWSAVAEGYAALVEPQLAGADLGSLAREITGGVPGREEAAGRILAWMGERIRYTGLELGMAALVPTRPREVLERRYGDCKDVSLLFVGLMRALGHEAHVALVRTGTTETDPALPGLGAFDHAIVQLGGAKPIFLDPLAPEMPLGVLPAGVDGKLALVARRGVKELVRLPVAPVEAWRIEAEREVRLPAGGGRPRVSEVRRLQGAAAGQFRAFARSKPGEQGIRSLSDDMKERLEADEVKVTTDPSTTGDVVSRGEAAESRLGSVADDDGSVRLASRILGCLPPALLPPEGSEDRRGAGAKEPRKHPLLLQRPCNGVMRYRIVPPAGFEFAEPLPAATRVSEGPLRFEATYGKEATGEVVARFALVAPRGEISAKGVEAFRAAVTPFAKEAPVVKVRRTSTRLLEAGRGREALAELRRLVAAAPDDAAPHVRLALGYLRLGLVEGARAEARQAAKLQPDSGWVQRVLSIVLAADPVGRRLEPGCDLPGALAAAKRAAELEPKSANTIAMLAGLHMIGENGAFLGRGAHPDEAARLYLEARDELGERDSDGFVVAALLAAGRTADAVRVASDLPQGAARHWALLASLAADGRMADAVREAGQLSPGDRSRALYESVKGLSFRRQYARAAELLERASDGAEDVTRLLMLAGILRDASRLDETMPAASPRAGARRWLAVIAGTPAAEAVSPERTGPAKEAAGLAERFRGTIPDGFPDGAAADLIAAALQVKEEEVAGDLARLSLRLGSRPYGIVVLRSGKSWRFLATEGEVGELGIQALRRLGRGDVDGARRLLRWCAEKIPGFDDEEGALFRLTAKIPIDPASAPVDELRLYAAALAVESGDRDAPTKVLEEALGRSLPDATRRGVQAALAFSTLKLKRWPRVLELSEALREAAPVATAAIRIQALASLGRRDDVRREVRALSTGKPSVAMIRAVGHAALDVGEIEEGMALLSRVDGGSSPSGSDLNNLAWAALFRDPFPPGSVQVAQRASELEGHRDRSTLHTLAALLARAGEPGGAIQTLRKAISTSGNDVQPHDWLVIGMIAEAYDEPRLAIDAYGRVTPGERDVAISSYHYAERALARLTGQKGGGGRP